jgi:sigma-E factor negative regulatory protein RseA
MNEQISALMDGELDLDSNPHLYAELRKNAHSAECWATWHLIGDTMRGEAMAQSGLHARIMQQLESEPAILAPRRRSILDVFQSAYAVPMAASAAAVAFVGWMVWQSQGGIALQPEMAKPSIAQSTMPPEALNDYMLAHQEYAPSNGMQHNFDIRPVTYSESPN